MWDIDLTPLTRIELALAAERPCTKAVVLARGLGTRMRADNARVVLEPGQLAAADSGNKSMIPVGRPFLDHVLSGLADAGFTAICIVVAPDHTVIEQRYTGANAPTRFKISYAVQANPIGTADAVLAAEEFTAGEPFVVVNADNYYPSSVLSVLRGAAGPAGVAFSRRGLVRDGAISPDRVAEYAILNVGPDGYLRRIAEKPGAAVAAALADDARISMNCWRLTSDIYRACRDVAASPRGEFELPLAIQHAIDTLGMRVVTIDADATVLDLSRRADVPAVTARLRGAEVRL